MESFEIEIDGITFKVQPMRVQDNEELFYLVTTSGLEFTMHFDDHEMRLKVDRPAPYRAYQYDLKLANRIQAYNDDILDV